MSKPRFIPFLILLFFIGAVTIGIFVLIRMQLNSFMGTTDGAVVATNSLLEASTPPLLPTATMFDLTLDMLPTVEPTATIAISVAVVPSAQSPGLALSTAGVAGTVSTDLVNIRSEPSLAGEILGQATQGTQVQIIETSQDGLWVQVCCPLGTNESRQSWISAEFVDVTPASARSSVTAAVLPSVSTSAVADQNSLTNDNSLTGIVSTLANVRSGPSTDYATVGQVSEQTQITITGRNAAGSWWRICCPPGALSESWISAELITLAISQAQAMTQVSVITIAPAPTALATSVTSSFTPTLSAP